MRAFDRFILIVIATALCVIAIRLCFAPTPSLAASGHEYRVWVPAKQASSDVRA